MQGSKNPVASKYLTAASTNSSSAGAASKNVNSSSQQRNESNGRSHNFMKGGAPSNNVNVADEYSDQQRNTATSNQQQRVQSPQLVNLEFPQASGGVAAVSGDRRKNWQNQQEFSQTGESQQTAARLASTHAVATSNIPKNNARQAKTPQKTQLQGKSQAKQQPALQQQAKTSTTAAVVDSNLPEEWTAKLNSDDFLKQWYQNKPEATANPSQQYPADQLQEEQKTNNNRATAMLAVKTSMKQAMLSKFLTNQAQPKVESKSPLNNKQPLQEQPNMQYSDVPAKTDRQKSTRGRPKQAQQSQVQKQSLLQNRLRLTSNQPLMSSSLLTLDRPFQNAAGNQQTQGSATQRFDAVNFETENRKQTAAAASNASKTIGTPAPPTFKPEINKKSAKLVSEKAPIFSQARYQKELDERNKKIQQRELQRQTEIQEKELREQQEVAKNQVHRPGQKLDLNDFNRAYQEKMEQMHAKKIAKKETITREQNGGNTFAPVINKYSRKIAEAGGIANVKQQKGGQIASLAYGSKQLQQQQVAYNINMSTRASVISESQPTISATVQAQGSVLENKISPIKSSLQRLQQNKKLAASKKQTEREKNNQTPRLEPRKMSQNGEIADDHQQPESRAKFNKYIVNDQDETKSQQNNKQFMDQIRKNHIRKEAQKFQQSSNDDIGQMTFNTGRRKSRHSDISNYSVSDTTTNRSNRRSLLKQSSSRSARGGPGNDAVIANQLKNNTTRQEQIERKAAQVNAMFAQMLDKVGTGNPPVKRKPHNFVGGADAATNSGTGQGYQYTTSKSEVGRPNEELTISEDNFKFDDRQNEVSASTQANKKKFEYDFPMTEEVSSPFMQPNSAGMRGQMTANRLRKTVGVEGTGGGFSQIGNDESGLIDSEAQEFLMLEQHTTPSDNTPRVVETDNISRLSSSSMRYSALRASFPSQSGATKQPSSSILKPTRTINKSLLGRYNQNLAKNSAR